MSWHANGSQPTLTGLFDLSQRGGSSKCLSWVCFPANHSAKQCRTPCALRTACGECTSGSSECMWCSNMKQCVDSNAYVASFPFGQCMEWYTMSSCPRKWKGCRSCCGAALSAPEHFRDKAETAGGEPSCRTKPCGIDHRVQKQLAQLQYPTASSVQRLHTLLSWLMK